MFRLIKILNGRGNTAEPCVLPATASETYEMGEALSLASGALTKCAATATPAYIAAEDYIAPATGAHPIYVAPVGNGMIFECPIIGDPTTVAIGDKVTLTSDAMGVTATKTGGVATIKDKNGAVASGDRILVTF